MRIMAFGAHPDDIDFYCAGTLAKAKAEGHEVAIAIATSGNAGSSTMTMEEIAQIRHQEALNSASVIGAQLYWLGYDDEFFFNSREVRLHFIETVRKFRPDIILCPDKDKDYHPDHSTTGQILWDIHVMPPIPNIKTETKPCEKIAELYYMDTCMGVDFSPEFYIDISDTFETKSKMLSCHKSQESWMNDMYGVSCAEFAEVQARFRGFQGGCRYAECFRKAHFFPGGAKKTVSIF